MDLTIFDCEHLNWPNDQTDDHIQVTESGQQETTFFDQTIQFVQWHITTCIDKCGMYDDMLRHCAAFLGILFFLQQVLCMFSQCESVRTTSEFCIVSSACFWLSQQLRSSAGTRSRKCSRFRLSHFQLVTYVTPQGTKWFQSCLFRPTLLHFVTNVVLHT